MPASASASAEPPALCPRGAAADPRDERGAAGVAPGAGGGSPAATPRSTRDVQASRWSRGIARDAAVVAVAERRKFAEHPATGVTAYVEHWLTMRLARR